jgi:hypothetical protein
VSQNVVSCTSISTVVVDGTCCLRFKNDVATIPARLASGWLARLCREGVEPSGSLQKVSDHPSSFSGLCLAQGKNVEHVGTTCSARPEPPRRSALGAPELDGGQQRDDGPGRKVQKGCRAVGESKQPGRRCQPEAEP